MKSINQKKLCQFLMENNKDYSCRRKYIFHATNVKLAQSVEIEFRLSAKVPSVQLLVTNTKLRMKFQWPEKLTNYELNTLNKINLTLAETLQNRINPEVSSEKLYIYEVSVKQNKHKRSLKFSKYFGLLVGVTRL
ncbi:unnamed protein product [Schistosoma mattheei]|uniref:Uncharacterized protein n=1 Tax=Schistosoma mattheei TaxID=31246 RepID=A0A183PWF2_9TREM|nr:unnamed protein product [Schistosoma mattheei]